MAPDTCSGLDTRRYMSHFYILSIDVAGCFSKVESTNYSTYPFMRNIQCITCSARPSSERPCDSKRQTWASLGCEAFLRKMVLENTGVLVLHPSLAGIRTHVEITPLLASTLLPLPSPGLEASTPRLQWRPPPPQGKISLFLLWFRFRRQSNGAMTKDCGKKTMTVRVRRKQYFVTIRLCSVGYVCVKVLCAKRFGSAAIQIHVVSKNGKKYDILQASTL